MIKKIDMESILSYFKKNNFKNIDVIYGAGITHIFAQNDILTFCVIAPHEGNDFKYLLRVDPKGTHDRWSGSDIQKSYETAQELLKDFELENIYKELLEIYIKEFNND